MVLISPNSSKIISSLAIIFYQSISYKCKQQKTAVLSTAVQTVNNHRFNRWLFTSFPSDSQNSRYLNLFFRFTEIKIFHYLPQSYVYLQPSSDNVSVFTIFCLDMPFLFPELPSKVPSLPYAYSFKEPVSPEIPFHTYCNGRIRMYILHQPIVFSHPFHISLTAVYLQTSLA